MLKSGENDGGDVGEDEEEERRKTRRWMRRRRRKRRAYIKSNNPHLTRGEFKLIRKFDPQIILVTGFNHVYVL